MTSEPDSELKVTNLSLEDNVLSLPVFEHTIELQSADYIITVQTSLLTHLCKEEKFHA